MKRYKQIILHVVSTMSSIYNWCDMTCEVHNKEINSQCAALLVRPLYIKYKLSATKRVYIKKFINEIIF